MPEYDSSARTALAAYAEATNKPKIARWIRAWLHNIHIKRTQMHGESDGKKEWVLPGKRKPAGHCMSARK